MNLIITPIFIAGIIFMVILWLVVMWWLLMQLIGVGVYLFGLLVDGLRYISSFLPEPKERMDYEDLRQMFPPEENK